MSEFKKGDQIKVTVEGTVTYKSARDLEVLTATGQTVDLYADGKVLSEDVTIEKIEPPVEVFGPGAYVRHKAATYMKFLVLDNGYVDLKNNLCWRDCTDSFTSRDYERIEMAEVPL